MSIKIGLVSLGCAKNQVNAEQMLFLLSRAGYEILPQPEGADVAIVNTCGFIDSAKQEAIYHILQLANLKAEGQIGKILVTGCLSQRYQDEIHTEIPEVDGILGVGNYADIVETVERVAAGEFVAKFSSIDDDRIDNIPRVLTTPEHYAYIKIAEGCDNRCAYCIIPYLRGRFRSRNMDDVLYEARLLADGGVKELIVVAQDTSRYGIDLPGNKRLLPELLRRLCEIDGFEWIRIHYVYPDEIDDALIDVIAEQPKIVKYLDIPIQHSDSKILSLMNRRGDGEFLRTLFKKLRDKIPGLVLRTSVITGLPGEGEAEFSQLCEFLKDMRLERVGAFPFSPEEGTPAAEMEHPDLEIAMQRAQMVESIQSRIMDDYNESLIGQELTVLVDGYDDAYEQFYGRTYADSPEIDGRVWIASEEALVEGSFVRVYIDGLIDGDLSGYFVEV